MSYTRGENDAWLSEFSVREIEPSDLGFLWIALFYASHSDKEENVVVEDIKHDPVLNRYLNDWGRHGDMGFIAHSGAEPVGAAWVRLFLAHEADEYGFVDAATPELAASVVPDRQDSGIGTRLLVSLIEEARDVYPGVSLTARKGNPAVRLYESLGWKTIDEVTNRVGTTSVKMLLTF